VVGGGSAYTKKRKGTGLRTFRNREKGSKIVQAECRKEKEKKSGRI